MARHQPSPVISQERLRPLLTEFQQTQPSGMESSRNVPYGSGTNYFPNAGDLQATNLVLSRLPCSRSGYFCENLFNDFFWIFRNVHHNRISGFF